MTERIILSLELVENGNDARCSIHVPYDTTTIIFGPWMDEAIKEMRLECKQKLSAMPCKHVHTRCSGPVSSVFCKDCGKELEEE